MPDNKKPNELSNLAAALCAVQGELHAVKKDNTADAGKYSYTYADLASVWDMVRPLLREHGIAVIQMPEDVIDGNTIRLKTMLLHTSGEYLTSTLPMPFGDGTPQAVGSALTYARRYALCAMLGVATEDDDAAQAQTTTKKTERPQSAAEPSEGVVVRQVDVSETKTGVSRFVVHFSDGERLSTLDERVGNLATQLEGTGEACTYTTEQRGKWTNLKSIVRATVPSPKQELDAVADALDEVPPPSDDEIPADEFAAF